MRNTSELQKQTLIIMWKKYKSIIRPLKLVKMKLKNQKNNEKPLQCNKI